MITRYAILGLLNHYSQTGLELKRRLTQLPALNLADSSHQIYQILVQLQKEELVDSKVHKQPDQKDKKEYFITEKGLLELRKWITSTPEPPQIINSFLVRLSSSDLLEDSELSDLFNNYENEVKMQLLMHQEKIRRKSLSCDSVGDINPFHNVITDRITRTYESELQWLENLKLSLTGMKGED